MEMFVLSYVNVYPKLCLQVRFCLRLRTHLTHQYVLLTHIGRTDAEAETSIL